MYPDREFYWALRGAVRYRGAALSVREFTPFSSEKTVNISLHGSLFLGILGGDVNPNLRAESMSLQLSSVAAAALTTFQNELVHLAEQKLLGHLTESECVSGTGALVCRLTGAMHR